MKNKNQKKENVILKKVVKYSGAVAIIIIFGIMFTFGIISSNKRHEEKMLSLKLKDIGELVTQTCQTVVFEDSKVDRNFFELFSIPFTESRQVFSYEFVVDASINFEKITYEINSEAESITIKLPHAKIYQPRPKLETYKSYLDTESIFSRIDLEEHNKALLAMQETAVNNCLAGGLLDAAESNAQKLISNFVKNMNDLKDYTVNYEYVGE